MNNLTGLWGIDENLSPAQCALRAFVMFCVALVLLRISGMRTFGKGNNFDRVIGFLIGGVLSRGVVGATPFLTCVAGGLLLVAVHRLIGLASLFSERFEKALKGQSRLVYRDGGFLRREMRKAAITEADIYEDLRLEKHQAHFDDIAEVYVEKTGEISFVRKRAAKEEG